MSVHMFTYITYILHVSVWTFNSFFAWLFILEIAT